MASRVFGLPESVCWVWSTELLSRELSERCVYSLCVLSKTNHHVSLICSNELSPFYLPVGPNTYVGVCNYI